MHHRSPTFLDCKPIYVRRMLEEAGSRLKDAILVRMWAPVEIVLAEKPDDAQGWLRADGEIDLSLEPVELLKAE